MGNTCHAMSYESKIESESEDTRGGNGEKTKKIDIIVEIASQNIIFDLNSSSITLNS